MAVTPPAVEKMGRGRPRKAHPLTPRQRAKNQRIRDETRDFPTKEDARDSGYWKKWSLTALLEGVRRAIQKGYPEAVRRIARKMERRAQKAEEARADDDDAA
jgi:hypothetical protein